MTSRLALTLGAAFALTIVPGVPGTSGSGAAFAATPPASEWVIGPFVRGRNHSVGMPINPQPGRGGGFVIELPNAPGSAHYVTFRHGSLAGKRRIRMRYRIEATPGARVVATTDPNSAGIITPYFQRAGDNWTARGPFETFRWYATFATQRINPGVHEIVAPLGARWTAVQTSNAHDAPGAFRAAVEQADQVGFVLGGGNGYGHGVHVVGGRARLVVTDFRVE